MKTIISATDFSPNANNAAQYAASIAEKLRSKIILAHVYEFPVVFTEQTLAMVPFEDDQVRQSAEKKLNAIKEKLEKEYPRAGISTLLLQGSLSESLVEITGREDADMIVMGAAESSAVERFLMGSATSTVISEAGCPVLCVPKDATFRGIKKIVFSTDLNEDNLGAAESLLSFAKKFDAEIIFLFVDNKHLIHTDEDIQQMTEKIKTRIKYPKISGYISKDSYVTSGISFFLRKHPADLLIMLTHKKHFPGSIFHTSVTGTMSHQAKIPMLSMKFSDVPILSNA